ncbi:lactate/malate family dehydrogenase [Staphylococcus pseudoxylosus]|uniref:lactate/malate family dehydrogenase n=1 Tax=Staphylococcus pseudoxylosus TaxID=2282419 RepID=UPI000D1D1624|nr:lactate dehydrogenase [Staphylococcus pseudoxylosus]PTI46713.1 lactate dehydrogenase [Staphylococcus xylosus]MBM2657634.1 lactate dehydrogenase [Staphylococcus pseudoxylosus]MDW8545243.1 lactate dehydrogenase [Staphylococcus pseudoxylosus]MDW8797715.1 lactate dehydrogenase [Staphylococcus pseudoxylosus]MEB6037007.1 lactate dehydrogenase [Staphylococcus pseudoxylosus]
MSKLGIVGLGRVGSQVLTDVQYLNLFSEIVLVDDKDEIASGEALDHNHSQGLFNTAHIKIKAGDYQDLADADFIVVAASVPTDKNDGDRTLLAQGNHDIIKNVMSQVAEVTQEAIIIVISNPVDSIVYFANQVNYPTHKIIGTGTSLETSRFKTIIAHHYQIDPKNVEAFVIGEHGQHAIPVWSKVRIHGMSLTEYEALSNSPEIDKAHITSIINEVSMDVFYQKGWTNAAISKVTTSLIQTIALNQRTMMPLTSISKEYDLTDGAFSLPTLVDRSGIVQRFAITLDDQEMQQLKEAYEYIRETIHTSEK